MFDVFVCFVHRIRDRFEEHFEAPDQTMDGPESSKLKEQRKLTTAPRNMQVAIEESLDTSDTPAMQPMTKSADSRDNNQSACDLSHDELDLQLALRTNATDNAPLASRSGAYADALVRGCQRLQMCHCFMKMCSRLSSHEVSLCVIKLDPTPFSCHAIFVVSDAGRNSRRCCDSQCEPDNGCRFVQQFWTRQDGTACRASARQDCSR